MSTARILLPLLSAALAAAIPAPAQTVVSIHSGVVYYFDGSVFVGDQKLEQKFGRFPDIQEGRELRTEAGRAEILLTPGVVLRVADNSAIRMVSTKLTDTRVELLNGSGILEANDPSANTSVTVIYRDWQVRIPQSGVYRIDAQPPRVRVYKGEAEVGANESGQPVKVRGGEALPLAAVLAAEPFSDLSADPFKAWALNRSDAIAADNAIAAEIVDDPSKIETSDLGLTGLGTGLSYFPMTGIPSLGITNPYGLSFWSPYQSSLSTIYYPSYRYSVGYPAWPGGIRYYPRPVVLPQRIGTGTGFHPGYSGTRVPFTPPTRVTPPPMTAPRAPVSRGGGRFGGRR